MWNDGAPVDNVRRGISDMPGMEPVLPAFLREGTTAMRDRRTTPKNFTRHAATAAAVAVCLAVCSPAASAQDYPNRPVRWVVGFAAGGSSDVVARLLSEWLQTRLGQPFLVENRTGAGSNTAAETVVNAPPDGYTLLSVTSANAINATVNKRSLTFDLNKQIAPIAGSAYRTSVMEIGRE